MEQEEKGAILQRFAANCRKLQVESEICENATAAFHRLNVDGALSNDADDWLCCAMYSELQQSKMKDMRCEDSDKKQDENVTGNSDVEKSQRSHSWNVSLTKLLRCFGMNIRKFLKRMEHWNCMAQNSSMFQQEISELNRRLGITMLQLQHYKRIFKQLYALPASAESRAQYQMIYEFGWLLFLVVRNELPPFATTNLINGCQVLLCSLELIYVNALEMRNSDIINIEFPGLPSNWAKSSCDFNSDKFSALDAICQLLPELPQKGVCIMKNAFFHKAVMSLFLDQRLLGNDRCLRELIKDGLLEINLCSLNRGYAQHVSDISEIDERVLLKHKETKTPKIMNGIEQHESGSESDSLSQLLALELPQSLPSSVTKCLGQEEIELLLKSLRDMCLRFESAAKLSDQTAECRSQLASGLYFMLLEQLTSAELRRKPTIQVGAMLMQLKSSFNATLIACCLQLMLHLFASPIQSDLEFPWLLDCFAIDAFEFQKIIELVVRHASGLLPRDLIKHLRAVEAECLSCLIWRKQSSLWLGTHQLPSYESVQLTAAGQENEKATPTTSSALVICLRKLYQLAQHRLSYLCRELSLLSSYSAIWHLVEHSIAAHGVALLQQRHLDQLLMCAVYMFVRKSQLRISFSDILQQYRRQPHAHSDVYRAVHLDDASNGATTTDIIGFYNQVYVVAMAEFARQLHCSAIEHPLEERVFQNLSNNQTVRLKSNGLNTNIYVSPESLPSICKSDDCSANQNNNTESEPSSATNLDLNLKRAHSNHELSKLAAGFSKRPNILRRRTLSPATSVKSVEKECEEASS